MQKMNHLCAGFILDGLTTESSVELEGRPRLATTEDFPLFFVLSRYVLFSEYDCTLFNFGLGFDDWTLI